MTDWYELDETNAKKLQKLIDRKSKMTEEEFTTKAREIAGDAFEFFSFDDTHDSYNEAMSMLSIREAKQELDKVIEDLKSRGISNVVFDAELIRGFDYYTGIIFEVFDKHPENNRALFGGGRYDELLSLFGNEQVAAVGFGMGDVPMLETLKAYNLIPENILKLSSVDVALLCLNEDAVVMAEKVADTLRKEGRNVAINTSLKKVQDQIKYAEKSGIPNVIILGEDEVASGKYVEKNLI